MTNYILFASVVNFNANAEYQFKFIINNRYMYFRPTNNVIIKMILRLYITDSFLAYLK